MLSPIGLDYSAMAPLRAMPVSSRSCLSRQPWMSTSVMPCHLALPPMLQAGRVNESNDLQAAEARDENNVVVRLDRGTVYTRDTMTEDTDSCRRQWTTH